MNTVSITRRVLLLVAAGACLAFIASSHLAASEPTPLRILLTNDDGFDAPGIKVVHQALMDAGHDVTLVAPLVNNSGGGAKVTTGGSLALKSHAEGVWSVDGTPADSVLIGLLHVMKSDPPDLVLSGANFGQNVGYAINSGTVGAATVAMYAGYPAIALSVGVDYSEAGIEPIPFPSTFKAFKGAAEMTIQLIADLQKTGGNSAGLLPAHTLLNVNYPALGPSQIKGIQVLPAARSGGVTFDYEEAGETGKLEVKIQPLVPGEDETDWAVFARGYVTISVLDGDWDAGDAAREHVSTRLAKIEQR